MEREDLIKNAAPLFEADAKLEKVYATTDGQYFKKETHATGHAATSKELSKVEITRNEFEAATTGKKSKKA